METRKNYTIEALRFVFTCMICLWHCRDFAPWLTKGYIAVDFFFIVAGYFIYQSAMRHPQMGVLDFTINKVKRFFAPFLICWILLILLDRKKYLYISELSPDGILGTVVGHFHELFFCQCMGLTNSYGINHPMWFLSILLFGGSILFSLLRNFPKSSTSLFIPVICVVGLPLYFIDDIDFFHDQDHFFLRMIQGLSEMGVGIAVAVSAGRLNKEICIKQCFVDIVAFLCFVIIILISISRENYDFLCIICVPILLFSVMGRPSFYNKIFSYRIWGILGGLGLYMYFVHLFVASCFWIACGYFPLKLLPDFFMMIVYLVVVIVSAYILKFVSSKISI